MTYLILSTVFLLNFYLTINFALQINLYTSIGQIKQEISVTNGYFETFLTNEEYTTIIPGTIDFPDEKIIEQDLYSTNERLRNTQVYIHSTQCRNTSPVLAILIDPYRLLIKSEYFQENSRYSYVSQEQIQFLKDPLINGMILSVRLDNTLTSKTNMTYLTRGLWWAPRYAVNIINEQSATLQALADIHNEHERSYDITHSQLITGNIPLITSSPTLTPVAPYAAMANVAAPISSKADATNFSTYSYNITRKFKLYPKSIKTYPFLTQTIIFNYTLEATIYISSGTNSSLFQRVFVLQASEFLPAGIATFYLQKTGTCLGQGRLIDAAKNSEQKVYLGTDPDVKYTIESTINTIQSNPFQADAYVYVVFSNQKDKQTVTVTLTINSGFVNTILTIKNRSSSSITISQDPTNKSMLIVRGIIKPNEEASCSFDLKQSN